MINSYSKSAKETLLDSNEKRKKCCGRMLEDIISLGEKTDPQERLSVILSSEGHFKCASCFSYFLKGLFVVYGNITNPEKSYHLELSMLTEEERDAVSDILLNNGIEMKKGKRKQRFLLYIKDSAQIEDFLAVIGANKLAFDLMNSKILREFKGQTNRQINCDMANIKKTLTVAGKYIDMIEDMKNSGVIVRLPKDLRETAELRYANTQASMTDLGLLHDPPISKSGVKHRLDKIVEFYEGLKKEEK